MGKGKREERWERGKGEETGRGEERRREVREGKRDSREKGRGGAIAPPCHF